MRLIRAMAELLTGPTRPWTLISFNFSDGTGRTFQYAGVVLDARAVDRLLDVLLDEMCGAEFEPPIEVHRFDGIEHTVEEVGLLPIDD